MTLITTQDVEIVHAYASEHFSGVHWSISYEDAVDTINWFEENDIAHGKVGLARISDDCFELVAFGEHPEWGAIGVDSDYVTLDVGRRLAREGRVVVMALYGGPDDEPKTPEDFARIQHEMLWGTDIKRH